MISISTLLTWEFWAILLIPLILYIVIEVFYLDTKDRTSTPRKWIPARTTNPIDFDREWKKLNGHKRRKMDHE